MNKNQFIHFLDEIMMQEEVLQLKSLKFKELTKVMTHFSVRGDFIFLLEGGRRKVIFRVFYNEKENTILLYVTGEKWSIFGWKAGNEVIKEIYDQYESEIESIMEYLFPQVKKILESKSYRMLKAIHQINVEVIPIQGDL